MHSAQIKEVSFLRKYIVPFGVIGIGIFILLIFIFAPPLFFLILPYPWPIVSPVFILAILQKCFVSPLWFLEMPPVTLPRRAEWERVKTAPLMSGAIAETQAFLERAYLLHSYTISLVFFGGMSGILLFNWIETFSSIFLILFLECLAFFTFNVWKIKYHKNV